MKPASALKAVLALAALIFVGHTAFAQTQESRTNTTATSQTQGELGPARPASDTEVGSMLSEVKRRMVPFTLTEAQSGKFAEQGNTGHMQISDKQWDALTVKRLDGARTLSVTALTIRQAPAGPLKPSDYQSGIGSLIEVAVFLKEGFASWASGNAGPVVLELQEPTSVSTTNEVGFHVVVLVDGDISTAFIEDGGHWTVKKFKGDTPKNWPR
jgi:hypothetical protein